MGKLEEEINAQIAKELEEGIIGGGVHVGGGAEAAPGSPAHPSAAIGGSSKAGQ